MLILTSIFLLRQQRFNSSTLLRSLAYSVALSVRQAQVYGTSIRESSVGAFDTNASARAYGVYFTSGSSNSYILFADTNSDGQYTVGESVQAFSISSGYSISKFCATISGGAERCYIADDPGNSTITNFTVIFKRPNPDSCFATSVSANACQTGATPSETYASGYVQLKSGTDTRSVSMTLSGQISVGAQGS